MTVLWVAYFSKIGFIWLGMKLVHSIPWYMIQIQFIYLFNCMVVGLYKALFSIQLVNISCWNRMSYIKPIPKWEKFLVPSKFLCRSLLRLPPPCSKPSNYRSILFWNMRWCLQLLLFLEEKKFWEFIRFVFVRVAMNPIPLWALIDQFMFVVSVPASAPAETLSEHVC